ncbi:MAG: malate dehydrogenase [Chloroflexi bacterium]|nr:malate dehydrogenase [Chloroflexota bacterium]
MAIGRSKITVVGAGNVGASVAMWITEEELGDVVLVDIIEGAAKGKALDLLEAGPVNKFDIHITGSGRYEETANSDVVVITAGVPRKKDPVTGKFPSRDELVKINQEIVGSVAREVAKYSPNAVVIVVSNPLDAMCHVVLNETGFPSNRVIGMAGALDTARYKTFIAEALGVSVRDVHGIVLGGHGDEMVPLPRHTSIAGIPVREPLAEDKLQAIIERTRKGGGEIVGLLGYSGYYAPAAGVVEMVAAIVKDQKRIIPSAVLLSGQYGYSDLYIGVPAVLGSAGVEKVIEMQLDDTEKAMLDKSAQGSRRRGERARLLAGVPNEGQKRVDLLNPKITEDTGAARWAAPLRKASPLIARPTPRRGRKQGRTHGSRRRLCSARAERTPSAHCPRTVHLNTFFAPIARATPPPSRRRRRRSAPAHLG